MLPFQRQPSLSVLFLPSTSRGGAWAFVKRLNNLHRRAPQLRLSFELGCPEHVPVTRLPGILEQLFSLVPSHPVQKLFSFLVCSADFHLTCHFFKKEAGDLRAAQFCSGFTLSHDSLKTDRSKARGSWVLCAVRRHFWTACT